MTTGAIDELSSQTHLGNGGEEKRVRLEDYKEGGFEGLRH